MVRQRVITALCSLPILVVAIWFEKPLPWFTVFVSIWGILAILEFYRLVAASKAPPLTYLGVVLTLLFILSRNSTLLSILRPYFDINQNMPLILTSIVIISLIWLLLRPYKENAFAAWAWTIAGITYLGWLLGYLVALRDLNDGRNWVFFALFVTFASDSTAYFVGRTWGKHHLAPSISPAKTWEGAIGGVFGSIVLSLFFTLPTPLNLPLNYGQAMFLGLLVSILGQLGDLVKSLFKRNMGVKDSGKLLPGHGGVLDRTDSIVFAGVVVYFYALLTSGAMS